MMAATTPMTATMAKSTARIVLPVDLSLDPLVELTIPPCARMR
jgi:hypothetical protein